jgi:hypothetical protein
MGERRVEGGKLLGQLRLAAEGTSARIDEIIRLVRQGIIKAVSVGFSPKAKEPLKRSDGTPIPGGIHYIRQELLEASLVGVGGNANALQVARSLHVSDETIDLVFGEHAREHETVTRGSTAEHGAPPHHRRATAVNITIAQRISDAQTKLVALRDDLTTHLNDSTDEPDDADLAVRDELNRKIETAQRNLDSLEQAEKRLASTAVAVVADEQNGIVVRNSRPFAVAAKKIEPADHIMRSLVAKVVGHATKAHPAQVLDRALRRGRQDRRGHSHGVRCGDARGFGAGNHDDFGLGFAACRDFGSGLHGASDAGFGVSRGLAARGLRLNFGRSGVISIPTRTATPTIAGSFVAEGALLSRFVRARSRLRPSRRRRWRSSPRSPVRLPSIRPRRLRA